MSSLVTKIRTLAEKETVRTLPWRLISRAAERIGGRVRAWIWGWPRGHIGASPRIIGSKYLHVDQNASVGRHAWIEAINHYRNCQYNPQITIGQRFSASERLHISCIIQIIILDDCLIGSSVHITDHSHGAYRGTNQCSPFTPPIIRDLISPGPVQIGSRVWIGDNCVILGPAAIGSGSIIGANSVVIGDVPPNVIAVGSPAKVVRIFNAQTNKWDRI